MTQQTDSPPPLDIDHPLTIGIGPRRRKRAQLIALTVLGLLALNYPLLSLFGEAWLFLGIPILYWYLFSVWFVFILLVGHILETHLPPDDSRLALDDLDDED